MSFKLIHCLSLYVCKFYLFIYLFIYLFFNFNFFFSLGVIYAFEINILGSCDKIIYNWNGKFQTTTIKMFNWWQGISSFPKGIKERHWGK